MKQWLYFAGGTAIGAVAAGVGVFFWCKRAQEKTMDELHERCSEEQLKQAFAKDALKNEERKTKELLSAIDIFCDQNTKDCIVDLVNNRLTVQKMTDDGFDEETISDHMIRHKYTEFVSLYNGDSKSNDGFMVKHDYDPEDEEEEPNPEPPPRGEGVYLITEDDYVRSDEEYDHQALMYYALDDTLTDEDDDILGQDIVGEKNLEAFSDADGPAIFVRNEHLKIEYEIIWEGRGSYQSIILGEPDAPTSQRIFRKEYE